MPLARSPLLPSLRLGSFNLGLGFRRKLPAVLARSLDLSLDVVALQEVGDPALPSNKLSQYSLVYAGGLSQHEAGVALLLSQDLSPLCRSYRRSKSGRLVGAVLELSRGHQLLIVSAYMPTGLDHLSALDPSTKLAAELYDEIMRWTLGMQQVIVLGDLNETLTPQDRLPVPAARRAGPIDCLAREGFVDVYRSVHPNASLQPGFTHAVDNAVRSTRSRIDYIWTQGFAAASVLRVCIDGKLHEQRLSAHSLLWTQLQLDAALPPPPSAPLLRLKLPNLRALTAKSRAAFGEELTRSLSAPPTRDALEELSARDDEVSLSALASQLTSVAHDAAFATLPVAGAAQHQSKSILRLEAQRRDLTRLLRFSSELVDAGMRMPLCPQWRRLLKHCQHLHELAWTLSACACAPSDARAWLDETRSLLAATRAAIRDAKLRLGRARRDPIDVSPAAAVHRMLESDAFPSQLFSVIGSDGALTTSADELKGVMADHFESVFAVPPAPAAPLEPPPPACLFVKPGIDPAWYAGLMQPATAAELLQLVAGCPLVSAPGADKVSTAVWRVALEESELMRSRVVDLFSACLHTSTFPRPWKVGVVLPFVKDATKERSMSNIRPITLQSCLGKLFNRMLAFRLSAVCAQHPILHPAQRGFVLGGTTVKCVDELLDAWDCSRKRSSELYTLFYDIKQAYDSVQTDVLARALQRLHLPAAFVALIVDSLTGLESCVRTIYGHSRRFAVLRSLRQGDPLAPLLFALLMDALHCGLDANPFTQQQHGLRLSWHGESVYLPSLGYADDTTVLASTLRDLCVQNGWVHYFLLFNRMRLNAAKCELVGHGPDGLPVTAAALAAADISVEGVVPQPVPHHQSIRYLGAHVRFDGDCAAQFSKARELIGMFTRLISKFCVSISQAVYIVRVFVLAKLEHALRLARGPGTTEWLDSCDRLLVGCFKHAADSPLRLSHTAVALALGFHLPSWMEVGIKVSELFLRLNSSDARWGHIGRLAMRHECGAVVDASTRLPRPNSSSRIGRAAYLAVNRLQWQLHLSEPARAGSRHGHLFAAEPLACAQPTLADCSSASLVALPAGAAWLAHDAWCGFGAAVPPQSVHVYTDGSRATPPPSSAWSVAVADSWLDDNFQRLPANEKLLTAAHVSAATLIGASIACTRGVYPAELQAIARALAMFPLSFQLTIHSDSQASIAALRSYEAQLNERKRMRMAARPLLQLVQHLLARRRQAGGSAELQHIPAHTRNMDAHSVGNRLADYQANLSRLRPDRSAPLSLRELPLSSCEPHLHVLQADGCMVIDDLRRTALTQLRAQALARWSAKPDQGRFACAGMVELGRVVRLHGSPAQQATFVHVATNSIHHRWHGAPASLQQLQCAACNVTLTLEHFVACPAPPHSLARRQLRDDCLRTLRAYAADSSWLRRHAHVSLEQLLLALFPLPDAAGVDPALQRHRHLALCSLGAFSAAQATAAATLLGLEPQPKAARCALHDLRLLCLESIEKAYTPLKALP